MRHEDVLCCLLVALFKSCKHTMEEKASACLQVHTHCSCLVLSLQNCSFSSLPTETKSSHMPESYSSRKHPWLNDKHQAWRVSWQPATPWSLIFFHSSLLSLCLSWSHPSTGPGGHLLVLPAWDDPHTLGPYFYLGDIFSMPLNMSPTKVAKLKGATTAKTRLKTVNTTLDLQIHNSSLEIHSPEVL